MQDNPSAVPSESDVSPEEGENVKGSDRLADINELTGRKYTSLEDAKKGIKETYGFVGSLGDIKEKAKKFDELQTIKKEKADIDKEYYGKIDRMELLYEHPELKNFPDIVDLVMDGAKTRSKKPSDFFENNPSLKKHVERELKEQEAKNPHYTMSGQRLAPGEMGVSPEEFARLPLEEQKKIVEKLPGWNEPLGKVIMQSSKRNA